MRNGMAEAAVKLVKSTLSLTIASQATLTYSELDTLFSIVANLVNQRPIAVRNHTEDELHAITPNDLLLQRSRNCVPGATYGDNDSLTRRQQVMRELEETWWNMWVRQTLPHLVPYRKWKHEHRSLRPKDIVLVLYSKQVGKGDYRLGRVLRVHPDNHGIVRTVTVGLRGKERSVGTLPYVPKPLEEITLGIQRVAVICPAEEQMELVEPTGSVIEKDGVASGGVVACDGEATEPSSVEVAVVEVMSVSGLRD